jgi:chemotaxis protein methyltransferase CheR
MRDSVAEPLWGQLSELVAAYLGLHFPPERWHDLARGINSATRELACQDAAACLQRLVTLPWTQKQIAVLAHHLTIGETYFFREQKTFQILQEYILPTLLHARRGTAQRLHLWSAGCATGEEPYSIAILLHTLLPDLKNWQITLLATDINTRSLEKATDGVYGALSFRNMSCWMRDKYFKKRGDGRYEILPEIKRLVTFTTLNLVTGTYPSPLHLIDAMDAIFCRNVLMYFTPAQADNVAHRLYQALAPGGWLCVSPSETSHTRFAKFTTVNFPDAILYQKAHKPLQASVDILPKVRLPPPATAAVARARLPQDVEAPPVIQPAGGVATSIAPARPDSSRQAFALYAPGPNAKTMETRIALDVPQQVTPSDMAQLARTYANQGQLAAARQWVEKAIAADQLNAHWHYLHATILQEQGDLDAAMVALKRVLYLDKRPVLAHVALGNLARQQQRYQAASKHFEHALTLLHAYPPDAALPEAEGLTAARLTAMIRATTSREHWA